MKVIFAVDHDDADTLIAQLIRKHPAPASLTVVSSDHQIQRRAKARRAIPIDSDIWFDRVLEHANRQSSGKQPDAGADNDPGDLLTDAETQALIAEFESKPRPGPDSSASVDNVAKPPNETPKNHKRAEPEPDKPQKESPFENGFDPFPPGWFDDLDL